MGDEGHGTAGTAAGFRLSERSRKGRERQWKCSETALKGTAAGFGTSGGPRSPAEWVRCQRQLRQEEEQRGTGGAGGEALPTHLGRLCVCNIMCAGGYLEVCRRQAQNHQHWLKFLTAQLELCFVLKEFCAR